MTDPQHHAEDLRFEADYNVQRRHPERTAIYADYAQRSEALRQQIPWENLRYASPERCTIDWFPANHPEDAPLLVFMHGGFWRGGDKRVFSFIAENLHRAGISTALVGYELAPAVTVSTIASQVRTAVRHLLEARTRLRFDPTRVTLSGHSAGAQLAAMTSAYPQDLPGAAQSVRVIGLSGVYDLKPLLASTLRGEIDLSPEQAESQSLPGNHGLQASRYLIAVGGAETEGFIAQSQRFDSLLKARQLSTELIIEAYCTHFDIFIPFTEPDYALHERVLQIVTA